MLQAAVTTAPSALIKDTNTSQFMADVIEASRTVPVIVDLWAPWCGPCKQLGPLLEKAVMAAGGKVRMVKINVDENQQIAASLRVQSIPAVYAFFQGQPVDGFVGAVPESQIKTFVSKLAALADGGAGEVASLLQQADGFLAEGKADHAAALYSEVLRFDAAQPKAYIGLVRALLALNEKEEAQRLFDEAPDAVKADKAWAALETAFTLAKTMAGAGSSAALKGAVEADPKNHQARYDYALALFAEGAKEAAMDQLIELARRDRKWNDEAARKQLVTFFEAMGPMDPLTVAGRKKLSSVLFA